MISTIIVVFLILGAIATLYQWRRLRKERKVNQAISFGLESLLDAAREEVQKNTALLKKAKKIVRESGVVPGLTGSDHSFDNPAMLSSIITVIVAKYGNLRLSMDDFDIVSGDDYVSVYIDGATQDLVLSVDHSLEGTDSIAMVSFFDPDDSTYH